MLQLSFSKETVECVSGVVVVFLESSLLLLFFSVVFVMRLVKHRLCQVFYRIEFKREVLFLRHAGGPADSAQCYLGTQRCYRKVRKRLMETAGPCSPRAVFAG